ncbi:MAG: GspH/FimT family pseudopilin [Cardiobacteriaceae bacterium]|nr:GspH/FimT family pseudopilin [Cardiobacteriaceae bacterium]
MKKEFLKGKGFTLLEMMVAIAILAILVAMAAPAYRGMLERQKIRSALNEWQSAFFFARREAMRLKEPVILCASKTGTKCDDKPGRQFNQGWIVIARNGDSGKGGILLQDYAVNDPGLSIYLSNGNNASNGLIFRGNGSVAIRDDQGNIAKGIFMGRVSIGSLPSGTQEEDAATTPPSGSNTIIMKISSGGRLALGEKK